jgi:hypothetical protein
MRNITNRKKDKEGAQRTVIQRKFLRNERKVAYA